MDHLDPKQLGLVIYLGLCMHQFQIYCLLRGLLKLLIILKYSRSIFLNVNSSIVVYFKNISIHWRSAPCTEYRWAHKWYNYIGYIQCNTLSTARNYIQISWKWRWIPTRILIRIFLIWRWDFLEKAVWEYMNLKSIHKNKYV